MWLRRRFQARRPVDTKAVEALRRTKTQIDQVTQTKPHLMVGFLVGKGLSTTTPQFRELHADPAQTSALSSSKTKFPDMSHQHIVYLRCDAGSDVLARLSCALK